MDSQMSLFEVPIVDLDFMQTPVAEAVAAVLHPAPKAREVWPKLEIAVPSGEVGKYDANVAAIRLLNTLTEEGRAPTADERIVLNRYSGWGGLGQKFAAWEPAWRERMEKLEKLVTPEEWEGIKASVNNAHYTAGEVIEGMWKVLQKLGFRGGRIIEPSAGVGFFLGAMPQEIAKASEITAVEIDPVSARFCETLYGSHGVHVHACGFEKAPLVDGFYDLAISNVPFGSFGVVDSKRRTYSRFSIHNYFFAKALEVVRPGGLVAFVTSSFTLDATNSAVRAYLARRAKLVGAFRLPNTAFKQVANTSVTTDVIVLQRLAPNARGGNAEEWVETDMQKVDYSAAPLNRWYASHSDRMIGKRVFTGGYNSQSVACEFDGDLKIALDAQVAKFAEGGYSPKAIEPQTKPDTRKRGTAEGADAQLSPGSYVLDQDGKLWVREGETELVEVKATGKTAQRIAGLIGVRNAAKALVSAQVDADVAQAALVRLRGKLNEVYDAFVRQFDRIDARANRQAFGSDPAMPLLLSLEATDAKTGKVVKADVFTRRTAGGMPKVASCDTVTDAMSVVMDRCGTLDAEEMAQLLGKSEQMVRQELLDEALAFVDPMTEELVTADLYLSGNVRQKHREAEAAGDRYERNAKALLEVIPADLAPTDIGASLGSTWIPEGDYETWLLEMFGKEVPVRCSANTGTWEVVASKWVRQSGHAKLVEHSTSRIDAYTLIEQALNQQVPTIRDRTFDDKYVDNPAATLEARERQEGLKKLFAEWVWQDEDRAQRLARLYNDTFNCYAPWEPKGAHLSLPGYSQCYKLHEHQRNAIWRVVAGNRNALLGHVVGAGKTLTMVCAGMEMRRLGKAKKPMYVVPNHMLEQFATEFVKAYPNANILVASKADFQGDKRRVLLSRIATGDWDGVILTHSTFERIKLNQRFLKNYIEDRVQEILAESDSLDGRGLTFKELQRQKKVWEARLTRLAEGKVKDDVLSFDELGVDWLFVDEAHLFKNLYRFSKMQRVAGLPNSNSERAFDMLLKTRYVMGNRCGEHGVTFATGTPVSNSMAEMWVMQHYLQPGQMEEAGVAFFDAWATNFGEVVTAIELAPDGSRYRTNSRFARFRNLPELMGMFSEVADVQTAQMLKLPVPEATREVVVARATPALKAYVETLVKRADDIHAGIVDPTEDNMLAVTNDGRKAALDMRLADPEAGDEEGSKVALCVERVHAVWEDAIKYRGTQLVFCDLSTPAGSGFNVYDDAKAKLVKLGVPVAEIAFIHDYETDQAKERLFAAVRAGEVRILFGSTGKMGVGTNVQTRLVALHHLDAPWRPADVEQREGRIIRQGNGNERVRIFRYVTEGSFDAYMWQTLETKARFIAQVMSGDRAMRTAEDLELAALSYAEVKALASGNPLVLEKAGVDAEVAKLTVLRSQHERRQWDLRQQAAVLPDRITTQKAYLAKLAEDLTRVQRMGNGAQLATLTVKGVEYGDPKKIAEVLQAERQRVASTTYSAGTEFPVGRYGEFDLGMKLVLGFENGSEVQAVLHGAGEYRHPIAKTGSFILSAIQACLGDILKEIPRAEASIDDSESRLAAVKAQIGKSFDQNDKLASLLQRQEEVNKALGVFESAHSGLGEDAGAAAEAA